MRPLAVAITLWTVAARPAAAQVPYRVSAWDAASVLAAGGLSIIPEAAGLPPGAPPCAPCAPASLPRIDHAALHTFSGSAGRPSSVLGAGAGWLAAGVQRPGPGREPAAAPGHAVAGRGAVHRPRHRGAGLAHHRGERVRARERAPVARGHGRVLPAVGRGGARAGRYR